MPWATTRSGSSERLRSPLGQAALGYEGYTNLAPWDGYLYVQSGPYQGNTYKVGILDDTGGKFLIFDGKPTLRAPNEWGRFVAGRPVNDDASTLRLPRTEVWLCNTSIPSMTTAC